MDVLDIPAGAGAIIFDLDGTLLDSMPLHYEAYNDCLKKYGVHYPYELFISRGGIPTRDTFLMIARENAIVNFDVELAIRSKREFVDSRLHLIKPIDTTFNIMKKYHGVLPMSIGTGSNRQTVNEMYRLFELGTYIPISVTATDVSHFKPHPETFLRCAELMKVKPESCIVFEDGLPGIEAAKSAGMQVIDVKPYI